MKRLMLLAILGTTLGMTAGCHVGECWNYAWKFAVPPGAERPALPTAMPAAAVHGRRSVLRSVRLQRHGGYDAELRMRHALGDAGAHGDALDATRCRTDFLIRPSPKLTSLGDGLGNPSYDDRACHHRLMRSTWVRSANGG